MDPGPNSKGKKCLVGQSSECSECLLIHSGASNLTISSKRKGKRMKRVENS